MAVGLLTEAQCVGAPPSGTEGPKLASVFQSERVTLHRRGKIPHNRKWQGKERDADVLLDNHLQT